MTEGVDLGLPDDVLTRADFAGCSAGRHRDRFGQVLEFGLLHNAPYPAVSPSTAGHLLVGSPGRDANCVEVPGSPAADDGGVYAYEQTPRTGSMPASVPVASWEPNIGFGPMTSMPTSAARFGSAIAVQRRGSKCFRWSGEETASVHPCGQRQVVVGSPGWQDVVRPTGGAVFQTFYDTTTPTLWTWEGR